MSGTGYLLDNTSDESGRRFEALAQLFDESTFRHFANVGVAAGWLCWEVGAGGPSVAQHLAERVGARGRVVATDIVTDWIDGREASGIEVRQHDLVADPLPLERFDLVHARLVLHHLPRPDALVGELIKTLRPGGWLVIEDFDLVQPLASIDACFPEHHRANKLRAAFCSALTDNGADLRFARRLPRLFREYGLVNVGADAYFPVAAAASGTLEIANLRQVRSQLCDRGLAEEAEIDAHLMEIANERIDIATPPLISAWGQLT